MRAILLVSIGVLCSACDKPAAEPPPVNTSTTIPSAAPATTLPPVPGDASAGSSGVGRVTGDAAVPLDSISLIGTWSFDRSCASEDGMKLDADGTASTDQGRGMWAVDSEHRLIVIVREEEMGKDPDPKAERLVFALTATKPVGDDLVGRVAPFRAGQTPREVNARRCPETR